MSELPWSSDEEPVVLAFLAGEIERDDPRFRQLVAGRPELESTLDDLRRVEDDLDQLGAREREVREAAASDEPDLASVDAARRLVEAELPPRATRTRFRTAWIAAAAVVLCALGLRWALDGPEESPSGVPDPPERVLEETEYEERVIRPTTPQGPLDVFEWRLPPRFIAAEIRIFATDGALLFRDRTDSATLWRPTPKELETLRTAAAWSVWLERRGSPPRKWAEGRLAPR